MGYSTTIQVNSILAQTLTSATNQVVNGEKIPLLSFGNQRDLNAISDATVYQYIQWADEEIDGDLSEMYRVPLCEKADLELSLLSPIDEYNQTIELDKADVLVPGDVLVFFDAIQEERHIVDDVSGTLVDLADTLIGIFNVDDTRIVRVKYPPPITLISARLAAANIYDKYFSAEVDPNQTDYGKQLRGLARRDINNVLNGRTVFHGHERIGHRWINPNLRDRYRLPGNKSDQDTSRDIGKIEQ